MNYIWSKLKLLPFLEASINSVVSEKNYQFSDLFAGTWIVGRYFKEKWHSVTANDLQYYSYVLNRNYIGNCKSLEFLGLMRIIPKLKNYDVFQRKSQVLELLNQLPAKKWFIYLNYAPAWTKDSEFERMYFTDENAMHCDAIRSEIEDWKIEKIITEDEYFFLLASLLEAADKVANTASVYGAFLKKFKKSALKPLTLIPAEFSRDSLDHQVFQSDIWELIQTTSHDVVYLDPPYNERQYSANYHILETIARYDSPFIKWKTGVRDYSQQKSKYCKKSEVAPSFRQLIENLDANYIFLSYNDEWLMSLETIREIMSLRGEYGVFEKQYQRFKADKTERRKHKQDSVVEYLHYVKIQK